MKTYLKSLLLSLGLMLSIQSFAMVWPVAVTVPVPFPLPSHTTSTLISAKSFIVYDADKNGVTNRQALKQGEDMFLVSVDLKENYGKVIYAHQVRVLDKMGLAALDKNKDGQLTGDELKGIHLASFQAGDKHKVMLKKSPQDIFAIATLANAITFKDGTEAALCIV